MRIGKEHAPSFVAAANIASAHLGDDEAGALVERHGTKLANDVAKVPDKRFIRVRSCNGPDRLISWHDPCATEALDALFRATFSIPTHSQYLITDAECTPTAISSSLPTGGTFELVCTADSAEA